MNEQTLRKVLWADTIGSGVSVIFTIVGAALLADWLGISVWIPVVFGAVLIPWVLFLLRTVRREEMRPAEVAVIVVGNIAWALAAAVLIWGFPSSLTTAGKWIVGLFSLAVLDLGIAEALGMRRLAASPRPSVPTMSA